MGSQLSRITLGEKASNAYQLSNIKIHFEEQKLKISHHSVVFEVVNCRGIIQTGSRKRSLFRSFVLFLFNKLLVLRIYN